MASVLTLARANLQQVSSDWAANAFFVVSSAFVGRTLSGDHLVFSILRLAVIHAVWQNIVDKVRASIAEIDLNNWSDTLATRLGTSELFERIRQEEALNQDGIWNRAIASATNDLKKESASTLLTEPYSMIPKWLRIAGVASFRVALTLLIVGLPAFLAKFGAL